MVSWLSYIWAWIWFSSVRCNRTLLCSLKVEFYWYFDIELAENTSDGIFRPSVPYLGEANLLKKNFKTAIRRNKTCSQMNHDVTRHAQRWTIINLYTERDVTWVSWYVSMFELRRIWFITQHLIISNIELNTWRVYSLPQLTACN